ncbi:hypothetical protein [Ideonella sp.]|uniref:hypothetical protein n=1 Tax=Ideonella sp. TaxID=1929293 RepID=UPI0035B3C5FD
MSTALFSELPAKRPAPSAADAEKDLALRSPVGDQKEGVVVAFDPQLKSGYLREGATGFLFTLTKRLLTPRDFEVLHEGQAVKFFVNSKRAVVQLTSS